MAQTPRHAAELGKLFQNLVKGDQIFSVSPKDSVLRAIEVMADRHIGALLVMEQGKLLGIISERDYARKVILLGRSSSDTRVSQIMSSPVLTVGLRSTVEQCMELMTQHRVRHLPVLEQGKVTGMLSIGDLVRAVLDSQRRHISDLEQYIRS